jgi:hypothetical protein
VYVLLRGTAVRVRKPDGSIVEHVMKRNVAIPGGAARMISYDLYYDVGGYTIMVRADKAMYVNAQCPECKRLL